MPAYKLHGRTEFQGLPISIENRRGSVRHWKDENGDPGTTKMKHPYGYVRGTLGLDGDEVDVYVGPNKDSENVFVVTQMSKDSQFKDVDEQKVMLGFNSEKEAKKCYSDHMDDPRFFGSMKELTIDEFKAKLKSHKGKLIKALKDITNSAKIRHGVLSHDQPGVINVKKSQEAIEMLTGMLDRDYGPAPQEAPEPVDKALTAAAISGIARRARMAEARQADAYKAGAAQDQPTVGTTRTRNPQEPIVVPVRRVSTPSQFAGEAEVMKSCNSCGYIYKSVTPDCPRCEHLHTVAEAPDFWRR